MISCYVHKCVCVQRRISVWPHDVTSTYSVSQLEAVVSAGIDPGEAN